MSKHNNKFIQLGLNISYYRKLCGFTQEDLAEMAGISRTHLSNIEAPKVEKSLSLEVLFDIADALGINTSKLFELRWFNLYKQNKNPLFLIVESRNRNKDSDRYGLFVALRYLLVMFLNSVNSSVVKSFSRFGKLFSISLYNFIIKPLFYYSQALHRTLYYKINRFSTFIHHLILIID